MFQSWLSLIPEILTWPIFNENSKNDSTDVQNTWFYTLWKAKTRCDSIMQRKYQNHHVKVVLQLLQVRLIILSRF